MTLAQLMDAYRTKTEDVAPPYLWSDDELRQYADDAENEAAERARLLKDTTTPEICQVNVVAGAAAYLLDSRIISVERAKLALSSTPLTLSSTDEMDRAKPGWEARSGTPSKGLVDAEGAGWKLTLYPKPAANDTLHLQVFRLPIGPLSAHDGNQPEIPSRLHLRLLDWMLHLGYQKQDAETYDRAKSEQHAAIFTAAFGERIDANARRKQEDRAPCVVAFQEY